MSKIVVDQVQKSGGPALTLPAADGTAGQYMQTNGSGTLSFATPTGQPPVPNDSTLIVGFVRSNSAQQNTYSSPSWSSDGPNGLLNQATIGTDATSRGMAWNMLLGDGYPNGTTDRMFTNNREGNYQREVVYANNQRLGHIRAINYYNNNTTDNYTGLTWSVLPVRNTTGASITRSLNFYYSADYSSYGGAAIALFTPNAATYSATSGGTWTGLFTSTTDTTTTVTVSVVVPANTTVLVFAGTTHLYQTTYQFFDYHMYYGLNTFFDGNLICDLRMLNALQLARSPSNTNSTIAPQQIYTAAATIYGNR